MKLIISKFAATSVFTGMAVFLSASAIFAKGLDEIQPRSDEEKAEQAAEAATPEEPKPEPKSDTLNAETEKAPTTPENPTQPPVTAEKTAAPSATSLALAGKLSLGVGMGYIRIPKAKLGTFASNGFADFSVGYRAYQTQGSTLFATLRYQPIHAENRVDDRSYVAILDGYHLGATYARTFGTWQVLALAEIGYYFVYMKTRDRYPEKDKLEKNEVTFNLGTGADWLINEKLKIGPRVYAGFGAYQTVQISAATTMVF